MAVKLGALEPVNVGSLNYFSTRGLRRIMGYRWDNFVSNDRDGDEPGDLHDMTTPTATNWSRADTLHRYELPLAVFFNFNDFSVVL